MSVDLGVKWTSPDGLRRLVLCESPKSKVRYLAAERKVTGGWAAMPSWSVDGEKALHDACLGLSGECDATKAALVEARSKVAVLEARVAQLDAAVLPAPPLESVIPEDMKAVVAAAADATKETP